jgi:hypothetical protein
MTSDATFVCSDGIVPVRSQPDPQSERITDLLFGEEFVARSEHEGVVFGATRADKVHGFVPRESLASKSGGPTHRVRRTFIHVYYTPKLVAAAGKILPMNALVEVTGRSAAVLYPGGGPGSTVVELRSGGWVTDQGLSPIDQFEGDLLSVAAMFVGAVYLDGGKTWLGCDGPGFVQTVLAACGYKIPRRLADQAEFFRVASASSVSFAPLSVIYCGDSCAFGLESGEVIGASLEEMRVIRTSREMFFRRESDLQNRLIFPVPQPPLVSFRIGESSQV